MQDIEVSVADCRVHLDCSNFALDDLAIRDHVQTLIPLLQRLLTADCSLALLPDDVLKRRFRAIAAQNMMVDASIAAAISRVEILLDIISGHASIADHGFPEFQDERVIDV